MDHPFKVETHAGVTIYTAALGLRVVLVMQLQHGPMIFNHPALKKRKGLTITSHSLFTQ
jgi:hypothetical protein